MVAGFDPYRDWLGMDPCERPFNHYRLLALDLFEQDNKRIEHAEMIRMAAVLRHEQGEHAQIARQICDELEAAIRCLLDPAAKAAYDFRLRESLRPQTSQPPQSAHVSAKADFSFSTDAALAAPPEAPLETEVNDDFPEDVAAEEEVEEAEEEQVHPPKTEKKATTPAMAAGAKPDAPAKPAAPHAPPPAAHRKTTEPQRPTKKPIKHKAPRGPLLPDVPVVKVIAVVATLAAVFAGIVLVQQFWNGKPDASPALAQIADAKPEIRLKGLEQLPHVAIDPEDMVQCLVKLLRDDPDDAVREVAARQLASMGSATHVALPELSALANKEKHKGIKATLEWLVKNAPGSAN